MMLVVCLCFAIPKQTSNKIINYHCFNFVVVVKILSVNRMHVGLFV